MSSTPPADLRHREATEADLGRLLELNQAAVPAVGSVDLDRMGRLLRWADALPVLVDDDDVVQAFVLLVGPDSDYDSPNYRWFAERYERFLYVDRVVVAEGRRNRGLGAWLYEEAAAMAGSSGQGRVTAEVNLEPPNPGSSRFHRRAGFVAVGTLAPKPANVVEMLVRELDAPRT